MYFFKIEIVKAKILIDMIHDIQTKRIITSGLICQFITFYRYFNLVTFQIKNVEFHVESFLFRF